MVKCKICLHEMTAGELPGVYYCTYWPSYAEKCPEWGRAKLVNLREGEEIPAML